MKTILVSFLLFIISPSFANTNILSMAGCYQVTYEFKEVETAQNFSASPDYHNQAKELIVLDKKTPEEIHLQHILISEQGIIKHWRQEWYLAEKINNFMSYVLPNKWSMTNFEKLPEVWIQYVGNTDDSPRYSCAAKWENMRWKCDTLSPLPRREYTQRNDYNMMMRGNEVIITDNGWVHVQKNQKILVNKENEFKRIGIENGSNIYNKIDDSECSQGILWWEKRKIAWNLIRNLWKEVFGHHNPLLMDTLRGEMPLSTKLDKIVEDNFENLDSQDSLNKLKKTAHDEVHEYFLDKTIDEN